MHRVRSSERKFTSPLFNGNKNYERVAFETDLPRIEAADFGGSCNRQTGAGCTNPPPGAAFYPIYSTGHGGPGHGPGRGHGAHDCVWQLGGKYIPGTTNTFGGNSTAEYGPLLFSFSRPEPGHPHPHEQLPPHAEQQSLRGLGDLSTDREGRRPRRPSST